MAHIPYQQLGKKVDFIVSYRWLPSVAQRPFQGMRCDWTYEDPPHIKEAWMIWPEFIDDAGAILADNQPIPTVGRAAMYVIVDQLRRDVHATRINVGTTGHFVAGSMVLADAVVVTVDHLRDA